MGKAEDVARERILAKSRESRFVTERQEQERQRNLQYLCTEIDAEVPRALARLEAAGYPDVRMDVIVGSFGRKKEVAYWDVLWGWHPEGWRTDEGPNHLRLYSNGKFRGYREWLTFSQLFKKQDSSNVSPSYRLNPALILASIRKLGT